MKILVPVKRVIDPHHPVRIDGDGLHVVRDNVPHAMNPFDEVALSMAASMRTNGEDVELIAVTIGGEKSVETLRTALAMGADRAVHIVTDTPDPLTPYDVARVLRKIFDDEQPDLVLMGKQAIDSDAGQTPALLAGFLDVAFLPDSFELTVKQNMVFTSFDRNGCLTHARAKLPAIIACELHLFEPRPISLAQMMKAKQKLIARKTLDELGVKPSQSLTILAREEPRKRPPCRLFEDVQALCDQLQRDGLLK